MMNQVGRTILLCLILMSVGPCLAMADEGNVATRYSLGSSLGITYDPGADVDFMLLSAAALYDYEAIWHHRAPDPLRFKVEGHVGSSTGTHMRAVASANILALYFLDHFTSAHLRPYLEAGIGIIYTDFKVEGQGLWVNFNPQAGVGMEIDLGDGAPWFSALRLHHVSNVGLHHDYRGINSVVLQVCRFF
ncbi:MAG: acyloxyacyl hydrolase [Desulfuromonadaceae bacterium]|nr:acyloxyacyl hydrolase [Desulfuromonadaceae bacterium]